MPVAALIEKLWPLDEIPTGRHLRILVVDHGYLRNCRAPLAARVRLARKLSQFKPTHIKKHVHPISSMQMALDSFCERTSSPRLTCSRAARILTLRRLTAQRLRSWFPRKPVELYVSRMPIG